MGVDSQSRSVERLGGVPAVPFGNDADLALDSRIERLEAQLKTIRAEIVQPSPFFRVFPATGSAGSFTELLVSNGTLTTFPAGRACTSSSYQASPISLAANQFMLMEMPDPPYTRFVNMGGGGSASTEDAFYVRTSANGVDGFGNPTYDLYARSDVGLTVKLNLATGRGAIATAVYAPTSGQVTSVSVINGGTGFTSPPVVNFIGGTTGSTATATANIFAGSISSIVVTYGGTMYTSAPGVYFSGGPISPVNSRARWDALATNSGLIVAALDGPNGLAGHPYNDTDNTFLYDLPEFVQTSTDCSFTPSP